MALKGFRVIELAGLAPAPFCGMILSDFGAQVTRVDRVSDGRDVDRLCRGKRSIALDIKNENGAKVFRRLCASADVLIEPFRKGVMEKLNLGPDILLKENTRLVYARLTGFGQDGPMASAAGHDINYVALAGVLSMFRRKDQKPFPPINIVADFAGGGMLCALGITMALLERERSGKGQVIDANMVEGSAYVSSWLYKSRDLFVWGKPQGENLLDSGAHMYDTYQTRDGKYIAVGALEPQFYQQLVEGLGLTNDDLPDMMDFERNKEIFTKTFLKKTREEWCAVFDGKDACVTPVLTLDEAPLHPHNVARGSFLKDEQGGFEPRPAPLLSRTPANPSLRNPRVGEHTQEVLLEAGYSQAEIRELVQNGTVSLLMSSL